MTPRACLQSPAAARYSLVFSLATTWFGCNSRSNNAPQGVDRQRVHKRFPEVEARHFVCESRVQEGFARKFGLELAVGLKWVYESKSMSELVERCLLNVNAV